MPHLSRTLLPEHVWIAERGMKTHRWGRIVVCGLMALEIGCRSIPTAPSAANVAGRWEGQFKIVECSRVSGEGPSTCRSLLNVTGPIRLTLEQQAADLIGDQSLYGSTSTPTVSGPIRGKVTDGGNPVVVIRGTLRQREHAIEIVLVEWNTPLQDGDPPSLVGRYRVRRSFDNAWGRQVYDETHEIQSLARISSQ